MVLITEPRRWGQVSNCPLARLVKSRDEAKDGSRAVYLKIGFASYYH